jgi:Fe-Mn family superoxide dismutase
VKGANGLLEELGEARDKEQWGSANGLAKNLAFHLSVHILYSIRRHIMTGGGELPCRGRRGRPRGRDRRVLRILRRLQGPADEGRRDHPGFQLGRPGLRAAERPADRGAGLRPPGQRRPGLDPDPGLRRLGAHTFCLQCKNQKVNVIDAMWTVVNWQDEAKRYGAAAERGGSPLLAS